LQRRFNDKFYSDLTAKIPKKKKNEEKKKVKSSLKIKKRRSHCSKAAGIFAIFLVSPKTALISAPLEHKHNQFSLSCLQLSSAIAKSASSYYCKISLFLVIVLIFL